MSFPLAKFLERFGVILTAIIVVIAFYVLVALLYSSDMWEKESEEINRRLDAQRFRPYIYSPYNPTIPGSPTLSILFLLVIGSLALIIAVYHGLRLLSPLHERILTGTVFIAFLAAILFWIKVKRLLAYAVLEIVAALVLAAKTMSELSDYVSPIQLLSLITAAYLVVRGLDNFRNGLIAKKEVGLSSKPEIKEAT